MDMRRLLGPYWQCASHVGSYSGFTCRLSPAGVSSHRRIYHIHQWKAKAAFVLLFTAQTKLQLAAPLVRVRFDNIKGLVIVLKS